MNRSIGKVTLHVKRFCLALALSIGLSSLLISTATGQEPTLLSQRQDEADRKSAGCLSCHTPMDEPTMHPTRTVRIGCVDCHGGDATVQKPADAANQPPYSKSYQLAKQRAHVQPRRPELWKSSANPVQSFAKLNDESPEFIRFVNPGDLRVAMQSCGSAGCHTQIVANVQKSMMTHGAMLWGAALYNNGSVPFKDPRYGESYTADGLPRRLQTIPPPTPRDTLLKGILPYLDPLPRWEVTQPGNILRVFERGGRRRLEVGNPDPEEEGGKPDKGLSVRGLGTLNRTDPVFIGLQKTRLLDPMLSFMGTNDQPGDYRSSGCTACHVVYANDRDPMHAGPYAPFKHRGHSFSADPTIPKNESGHPIKHVLTRAIPSSQCIVCHVHPGTTVTQSYLGYTWWDNETDGEWMYPAKELKRSPEELEQIQRANPEGSAQRGLWGDKEFLANLYTDINPKLSRTQFADFHGHGWVFRAVYSQDRKGNLLDANGQIVSHDDPDRFKKAVHLRDIHLERGMHCVDCHFEQDVHGNGKLYGEVRAAIEIDCIDCHGTIERYTNLRTSGPAAPPGGTDLSRLSTPWGPRRFVWRGNRLYQRSMVNPGQEWPVRQVKDTITPGHADFNQKSALAKTLQRDGQSWGTVVSDDRLAHANKTMTCIACHTSWTTSCFGCHLPQKANKRKPMLHNEGEELRNYVEYNFQTLRDDVFMLGLNGTVTGRRINPIRSACAVLVGSQNQNREWIYSQQQTVSAEGYSGTAFSPFVPHTVRSRETKQCTDCHISRENDNNAWMAMVLMQGTNFYNFLGRYVYVAEGRKGFEAVVVTEHDEPQAVIGSTLHQVAYPERYKKHKQRGDQLQEAYHHPGNDVLSWPGHDTEVLSLQLRGEYLYTANGAGGFRVYDVAQIDQKGFSERIVTAPVSPLGQQLYVKTRYATAVASPSTMAIDPTRPHRPENEEAEYRDDKQRIPLLYAFLYVTDKYEGLIVIGNPPGDPNNVGVATLLDGNPENNFLKRAVTFNPNGILNGAVNITIAGLYAYICCDRGVVVVSLENPLEPKVVAEIGPPVLVRPKAVAVQFRYAFVCDAEGVKVLDVTALDQPRPVPGAVVPLAEANNLYLVRTYAYVAAGKQGLAILDIERPEQPRLDQWFNANGKINDARDVKVGMTNASQFAYIADGHNGLRVVQLFSPRDTPHYLGFSPRPNPRLIATYHTHGPALAISEGLDRDRAVDESGYQLAVFGRRGSRPFNLTEMQRLYLRAGRLYTVTNDIPTQPVSARRAGWLSWLLGPMAVLVFLTWQRSRPRIISPR